MARYVGKRIVPKHCGYWDNTKAYEMENIVYDRTSGNSYISRQAVPAGTDISQEEYGRCVPISICRWTVGETFHSDRTAHRGG